MTHKMLTVRKTQKAKMAYMMSGPYLRIKKENSAPNLNFGLILLSFVAFRT